MNKLLQKSDLPKIFQNSFVACSRVSILSKEQSALLVGKGRPYERFYMWVPDAKDLSTSRLYSFIEATGVSDLQCCVSDGVVYLLKVKQLYTLSLHFISSKCSTLLVGKFLEYIALHMRTIHMLSY